MDSKYPFLRKKSQNKVQVTLVLIEFRKRNGQESSTYVWHGQYGTAWSLCPGDAPESSSPPDSASSRRPQERLGPETVQCTHTKRPLPVRPALSVSPHSSPTCPLSFDFPLDILGPTRGLSRHDLSHTHACKVLGISIFQKLFLCFLRTWKLKSETKITAVHSGFEHQVSARKDSLSPLDPQLNVCCPFYRLSLVILYSVFFFFWFKSSGFRRKNNVAKWRRSEVVCSALSFGHIKSGPRQLFKRSSLYGLGPPLDSRLFLYPWQLLITTRSLKRKRRRMVGTRFVLLVQHRHQSRLF